MAYFVIRIELHGADWRDYEWLHESMEKDGFSRTVYGDNGTAYRLPPAEYVFRGSFNREEVHDKAWYAAKRAYPKFDVFATETVGVIWSGLEPAS